MPIGRHGTPAAGETRVGAFDETDPFLTRVLATAAETVFERGYTRSPDGTDFGLSIVGQVAEAHGWTVELRGIASGGVRFEVTDVGTAEGNG